MRAVAVVAALVGLAVPVRAHADDEIVRGSIVKIEAQEIYVNIGVDRGIAAGSALRIKRPVSLRHPVTRALVQDWIPIGAARVTQAGSVMSRAVVGELVDEVKVGDIAEVLVDRPDRVQTARPTPVPAAAPARPPTDPVTAEVLGVFAAQANQPLEARIAAWERYLSMRANSPYAEAIKRDLDQLHTLREEMRPRTSHTSGVRVSLVHEPPKVAAAGSQIPLVFVVDEPEEIASAYLHYRVRGNRTYRSVLLVREHDIYLRGSIPAEVVTAGGVDYFVEATTPKGRSGLARGTPVDTVEVALTNPSLSDP
jgi:hypothetical protein